MIEWTKRLPTVCLCANGGERLPLYRFIGERNTKGNQCKSKRWVRVTRGRTGGCQQERVTRRWNFLLNRIFSCMIDTPARPRMDLVCTSDGSNEETFACMHLSRAAGKRNHVQGKDHVRLHTSQVHVAPVHVSMDGSIPLASGRVTERNTKASYLKHLGTSGYVAKKGKEHGKTDVHYPRNICCKRGSKFVLY
jgi:hypothetical protein